MRRGTIAVVLAAALLSSFALAATVSAAAKERVKVRVGEHQGFSRIVFDWPTPVTARLEQASDQALLHFDRIGVVDLARYKNDPPPGIQDVAIALSSKRLTVALKLAPGYRPRMMEVEGNVVFDALAPGTSQDAAPEQVRKAAAKPSAPPPPPAKPAKPSARSAAPEGPRPTRPPAPNAVGAPISLLPDPEKASGGPPPPPAKPSPTAVETKPLPPADKPAKTKSATPEKAAAEKAVPEKAPEKAAAPKAEPAAAPTVEKQAAAATVEGVPRPVLQEAAPGPVLLDTAPAPVRQRLLENAAVLRFDWGHEVAAALYRQGPYLWLLFDAPPARDLSGRIARQVPEMAPVAQFEVGGATLMRFAVSPILTPHLRRDGTAWVLDPWPVGSRPKPQIVSYVEPAGSGARVYFEVHGAGRKLAYMAPGLDLPMIVVPSIREAQGFADGRALPQFRALPSLQGLAFMLRDESVQVTVGKDGVRVGAAGGLLVSHGASRALLKQNVPRPDAGPRLFDLAEWRRGGPRTYPSRLKELQRALVEAPPEREAAARLDLARFYFARGLIVEALAVIELGRNADPPLAMDPELRLIRGIGRFLSDDYVAAESDLYHPAMNGEAEAMLWHAAMAAISLDWPVAADLFAKTRALIDAYPPPVRTRLRLLAAEARLEIGDPEGATEILDRIRADDPGLAERSQTALLAGRILLAEGKIEEARDLWTRLAMLGNHPKSQTRARLALLDLALAEDKVAIEQAIDELERLRFLWRGDHFELAMLERLGDLHLRRYDYRGALQAYRQAASYFPNSKQAQAIAQRMRDIFSGIYLGSSEKAMPPLTALALYEEFKELTPPGKRGDAMIGRLTERLVEVDLLDRAAHILSAQVKYRLAGEDKIRAGTRLAEIQFLDEKPETALETLEATGGPSLPADLVHARRQLKVRALSALRRYGEAIKVLGDDQSAPALRLRADILMAQKDWAAAALVLPRLLPATSSAGADLSDDERQAVVDLAVAYTMMDARDKLTELNKTYGAAMARSPERSTFSLLADGLDPVTAKSIAEALREVADVNAFVGRYRQQNQRADAAAP